MKNHKPSIKLVKSPRTMGSNYLITGMKNAVVVHATSKNIKGEFADAEYRVGESISEAAVQNLVSNDRYDITISNK